jgi:hypothetical protein
MKYLKNFNESIEIIDQHEIEIDKFKNELTQEENWDLNRWSFHLH